jgi:hypothetical protein
MLDHVLSGRNRQALAWLAARPGACIDRAEFIAATGLSDAEYDHLLPLLARQGYVQRIPVDDGIFYSGFQVSLSPISIV